MLKINGKTFLNLQEAVAWLMENNCIPFQCTAPYVANTEIGMGTIVNPSPAKVRIGSIIFFSDSKVSTVTGITQNGFMVSDKYNDLVDDVVYVQSVAIDSAGHLKCTMSNGTVIDAGLVKQISGFTIDASQHLIASFNDGSTEDLGAIFSGNVNISGDLHVSGSVEQDTANYITNIYPELSGGLTYETIFCKLTVINGVAHIVMNLELKNETAADITTYFIGNINMNLLTKYAEKILDMTGHAVSEIGSSAMITDVPMVSYTAVDGSGRMELEATLVNVSSYANRARVAIKSVSSYTVPAGSSRWLTGRLCLTLF